MMNEGEALRWIKVMKIVLISLEVLQHLLSRPFRRIIVRSAESVKHVNSVPRMVAACVMTAQRSPNVSRKTCGNVNFRSVGENTRFWSDAGQIMRVGDWLCKMTPMWCPWSFMMGKTPILGPVRGALSTGRDSGRHSRRSK